MHDLCERGDLVRLAEEFGDGNLLGFWRPGADVPEDVAHAGGDVRRRDGPADAQAGGGECFRDAVDEDRVVARVVDELRRRVMPAVAEGELPIDLIPQDEER